MSRRKRFTSNQVGIVSRLLNGPWPCRAQRDLIPDPSWWRADHNAGRALSRLVKVGLVERYTDPGTGDENWRIRRDRFELKVIDDIDELHKWEGTA